MSDIAYSIDEAMKLCDKVYEKNRGKWWSFYYWWCWGCRKFSKSPTTRCFFIEEGTNTGCPQINRLYNIQLEEKPPNR